MTSEKSPPTTSARRRVALTVGLCWGFCALGISLAMLGPTLVDLAQQTGSTVARLGGVFTARSFGYLLGSMVGGELFDRVSNACLLMAAFQVICFVGGFCVPFTTSIVQLGCSVVLQGSAMGMLDTGGNVIMLRLWGSGSGPYMQCMHFAFGLGAFIAPFIAKVYISHNVSNEDDTAACSNVTIAAGNGSGAVVHSDVENAFYISSALMLPVALFFLILSRNSPKSGDVAKTADHESNAHRRRGAYHNKVIAFAFLFLLIYVGNEIAYGGYVYSYAVKFCPLQFTASDAAYLTAAYWGFFALGRCIAIPLSVMLPAIYMVVGDLVCITGASIIMLAAQHAKEALWVGTALFGLGMASMFPCMITLAEEYVDLTGRTAGLIVVGAALGEMLLPLLLGGIFGSEGPRSFMAVTFGYCIASIASFIIFIAVSRKGPAKVASDQSDAGSRATKSRAHARSTLSSDV